MTAAGYVTDVTYVPGFYPQMSPVAMRYVAALNGVIPPRLTKGFRFLELGCGLGRCLTTLAAAHPQGEFVGVDLNPEHTAAVARDIAAKDTRVIRAAKEALNFIDPQPVNASYRMEQGFTFELNLSGVSDELRDDFAGTKKSAEKSPEKSPQ